MKTAYSVSLQVKVTLIWGKASCLIWTGFAWSEVPWPPSLQWRMSTHKERVSPVTGHQAWPLLYIKCRHCYCCCHYKKKRAKDTLKNEKPRIFYFVKNMCLFFIYKQSMSFLMPVCLSSSSVVSWAMAFVFITPDIDPNDLMTGSMSCCSRYSLTSRLLCFAARKKPIIANFTSLTYRSTEASDGFDSDLCASRQTSHCLQYC